MPRTALIVVVPEAQAVVVDGFAEPGVPAHVTILYPFADGSKVDETAVAEIAGSFAPFDFELDGFEQFDDGLAWLRAEPAETFVALTNAVWNRFPDYPPYEGAHDVLVPHLTISKVPVDLELELPIRATAREVTLIQEVDGRWSARCVFPLQGVA
jgi:hypothetical protein